MDIPIRDKLKQLLQVEPNTYTQSDLSRKLGISREYVRLLVNKAGLRPLLRVREPYRHLCLKCGKAISKASTVCVECRRSRITLTCPECKATFTLRKSEYKHRLEHRKASGVFCSRGCSGKYVGRTFSRKPKRSYPDSKFYGGTCAFCGTPFSNIRELLRHRNTTRELNDPVNRRKLINYRMRHTIWQTLAHFRVNQDTLRAIMKGLPTAKHSQSTTLERNIHDAATATPETAGEG